MTGLRVSAPGKAFLCGEYAVTEGAPAIIAAVGRRVTAGFGNMQGDGYPLGPEATATLKLAEEAFGPAPSRVALDRHELFEGKTKLGLGSSAASAVAIASAIAAHHGHDLTSSTTRRLIFEAALSGHQRVAPEGSGADVAAATHGGFIHFQRSNERGIRIETESAPKSLVLSLVWTGAAVRTSDFLRRVKQLRMTEKSVYADVMERLHDVATDFASAFHDGNTRKLVEVARQYHEAMATLGRAADAPIVDDSLAEVARAASLEGGAAKPCGAGGGDVAIAFFESSEAARRFTNRCRAKGLMPIDLVWNAPGAQVDV